MSNGPIQRERERWKRPPVSTPDAHRVCARSETRSYCGRSGAKLADDWADVTCTDCRAAYRADGGRIELLPEAQGA